MSQTVTGTQRKQDLHVPDTFEAATKYFSIPHPGKEGMRLFHASIETNRHEVNYTGTLEFPKGKKKMEIPLPEYFFDLVDLTSVTVQLTPVKDFIDYAYEVVCPGIFIYRKQKRKSTSVSFVIRGERIDVPKLIEEK